MAYVLAFADDFSVDHTQDPTWWVWKGNRSGEFAPVVVDGQLTIPHIESDVDGFPGDIVAGLFMGGGEAVDRLAQRMTVKFSKSAVDQWIYVSVRARERGDSFDKIAGYAGPSGAMSIESDGGTSTPAVPVSFDLGAWYWMRVTIDDFHTVIVEVADNADFTNSFVTFASELLDDSDAYRLAPGIGGIIATAGIIIDEVVFDRLDIPEEEPNEYDEYYYVGTSILTTTKKMLGLSLEDHSFDHDVITHINSAFNTLQQIGIGSVAFAIEDETLEWSDFSDPFPQFNLIKSFVYSYARLFFDPPTTTFHLNAAQEQLKELTWRLSVAREETDWVDPNPRAVITDEDVIIVSPSFDGGGAG